MHEELLMDESLIPDPDETQEMGSREIEPIADEDLKGSRFLLVRRSIETLDLDECGGRRRRACLYLSARARCPLYLGSARSSIDHPRALPFYRCCTAKCARRRACPLHCGCEG